MLDAGFVVDPTAAPDWNRSEVLIETPDKLDRAAFAPALGQDWKDGVVVA